MALIKFEEKIKEKLEYRTIEPSGVVWEKLSERLDKNENRSKSKIYWWIGIAASIIGVFLVFNMLFNRTQDQTILPDVVETPTETSQEKEEYKSEEISNSNDEAIAEQKTKSNSELFAIGKTVNKSDSVNNKSKSQNSNGTSFVEISVHNKNTNVNNSVISNTTSEVQKTNQLLVDHTEQKEIQSTVTDSEIELLLVQAEKDLLANNMATTNKIIVDANSLLQDVESDLEETFRDKVFNTLISGYKTVKTAVASRND